MTEGSPSPTGLNVETVAAALAPPVSAKTRLRNYFLTGIVVAGTLAVTGWIVWWFINFVDGMVKPLVPARYLPDTYLPFEVPGFGLIIAFVGLTVLGFLTANLVGRYLVGWGELVLARMPIVSSIYRGVKQIFEALFSQSGTSFRKVGLVEFPAKGQWSLVFISSDASEALASAIPGGHGVDYVSVFLPCTPNPTTGFYFYLPRHQITEISMTVEEAAKVIMSMGMIQPEAHGPLPPAIAAHVAPAASAREPDPVA